MPKYTPAMQQYVDIKKQYQDCVLFFRLGDFYETFFEDAKICSKILDLVLTSKNKNSDHPIPMAGIPYHSVEKYIKKLVDHGHKVAIAEQMTEPQPGKIVQREVTSVITPGTYIQESQQDYAYVMSLLCETYKDGQYYHIAWGDFAIGAYQTKSFTNLEDAQKFILRVQPKELIFDVDFPDKQDTQTIFTSYLDALISISDLPPDTDGYIQDMLGVQTLQSYGQALEDGRRDAFALLLHYLSHTQKRPVVNITSVSFHATDNQVLLDDTTIKNLEILSSSYEGSTKYSLLGVMDTTKTAGGGRLLRSLLVSPTNDMAMLRTRQGHVEHWIAKRDGTQHIHTLLQQILDIPKLTGKILYKRLLPSLFVKLRETIAVVLQHDVLLDGVRQIGCADETIQTITSVYDMLQKSLVDTDDVRDMEGYVRSSYSEEIDHLRKTAYHSDDLLIAYQQSLVDMSGITNIKVKYITNQGYFIEVTNKDTQKFEACFRADNDKLDLQRRQTLKTGQRYVSPYLDELQKQILTAKDALRVKEEAVLGELQTFVSDHVKALHTFADDLAWLDVYTSHALFVIDKQRVTPEIQTKGSLQITAGRHPVIEAFLPHDQQFIPNDLGIHDEIHIITGPNMGGKSTFLRQNALIVLLAHTGLCVPAQQATVPLVDGIFARVGSGDVIVKNQSTFMTEMIEVANILHNASDRSFVIFDELGRGTSTYDGLALTKSIIEYIVRQVRCNTLVATHYHELIALENQLPGIKNFSVSVYETDKEVVFMKKIIKGGASKSYGLDVAKIAGIPQDIIDQATQYLLQLEATKEKTGIVSTPLLQANQQKAIDPRYQKIKQLVQSYDVNHMTPMQALQLLEKIKENLS